MTKNPFSQTRLSKTISTLLLTAFSVGMMADANATGTIFAANIANGATSCTSCHVGQASGKETKPVGTTGLINLCKVKYPNGTGAYDSNFVCIVVTTPVPTVKPTTAPTVKPTTAPTAVPTIAPTIAPTAVPTIAPTAVPTIKPTAVPTIAPTAIPTIAPTAIPTIAPTAIPTIAPTAIPTIAPTAIPTIAPTAVPTIAPTAIPTIAPTVIPTIAPTTVPTSIPTPALINSITTNPVISSIADEWNIDIDKEISIPLSIKDVEDDVVKINYASSTTPAILSSFIKGNLPGATVSETQHTAANDLPTIDFKWTPAINTDPSKVYVVKFTASETKTKRQLSSKPVAVKIHVWPVNTVDTSINKLVVSTTKWTNIPLSTIDTLTLTGSVELKDSMTDNEKTDFFNRTDLTAKLTQGQFGDSAVPVFDSSVPMTFDQHGNWTISIPVGVFPPRQFPCYVTMELEGEKAAHDIAGAPGNCVKN